MTDDPFLLTLTPTTHDLGGFKVHRTLPNRERTTVGPFIFFDQMGPAHLPPGTGIDVRPHPHINLATVTYLFAGAIDHRDSLGTFATIEPGAVNLMTAGKGITHSERSPAAVRPGGPALSGIQTWLALPTAKEEMDLDNINVVRSPICRPGSDCFDVELFFFFPARQVQTVRKVYRFTVDVSDVVPVTVGPMRTWFTR